MLTENDIYHLDSQEFLELLASEIWKEENQFLLLGEKQSGVPEYFYISAYLIDFETELMINGLLGLLQNSVTYNFENTLNSLKIIENEKSVNCLQNILKTLSKYGKSPAQMREEPISDEDFDRLYQDLRLFENELHDIFPLIWEDLQRYLLNIRGK